MKYMDFSILLLLTCANGLVQTTLIFTFISFFDKHIYFHFIGPIFYSNFHIYIYFNYLN